MLNTAPNRKAMREPRCNCADLQQQPDQPRQRNEGQIMLKGATDGAGNLFNLEHADEFAEAGESFGHAGIVLEVRAANLTGHNHGHADVGSGQINAQSLEQSAQGPA